MRSTRENCENHFETFLNALIFICHIVGCHSGRFVSLQYTTEANGKPASGRTRVLQPERYRRESECGMCPGFWHELHRFSDEYTKLASQNEIFQWEKFSIYHRIFASGFFPCGRTHSVLALSPPLFMSLARLPRPAENSIELTGRWNAVYSMRRNKAKHCASTINRPPSRKTTQINTHNKQAKLCRKKPISK